MVATRTGKKKTPKVEGGSSVRKEMLIFGKPQIQKDEINEVVDSMEKGWLGTGPKVSRFEDDVKKYLGVKHAMALNSCTAGLHLSLLACGVGPGDEVILPSMTFAATANVVEHIGARPIFVDCEIETMNIDPIEIEKMITKKTKVIIPVHMLGRPCNMREITWIARKHNLLVVEDAAHAFGAEYDGMKIGQIGDLAAFSFYATKNLVTGEGGLVTTKNDKWADFVKINTLHGMSHDAWRRYLDRGFKRYLVEYAGYKFNMMDIQAAIGIHQLKRFDKGQVRRKRIWKEYQSAFVGLPMKSPAQPEKGMVHAYHLYPILVDLEKLKVNRDVIQTALYHENIGVGTHFIGLHMHPFYKKKYGFKEGDYPNTKYISERTISIPFSAGLTDQEVKDVIEAVRKVLEYYKK